jgi:hypothetical protein
MELTDVGVEAAARELHHLASGKPWAQASQQLRADFRGYVESIIDKAYEAEVAERARSKQPQGKGVRQQRAASHRPLPLQARQRAGSRVLFADNSVPPERARWASYCDWSDVEKG